MSLPLSPRRIMSAITGADEEPRTAIIDIGSNSIRLVVYQGPPRLPATLFNEKALAGLGRSLAASGKIDEQAMAMAATALHRFAALAREMAVGSLRTVATAAVRDASNGAALIAIAEAAGLTVEILPGEEEARAAGMGVLSGIPDADGIVGDLGGGSLELVRVKNGELLQRTSFPLGVLRIGPLREKGKLAGHVQKLLAQHGWIGAGKGLPLYLVGGSWRALARLDMAATRYPLPVIHQYAMPPATIARLRRTLAHVGKARLKAIPGLSSGRIPTLLDAAGLLSALLDQLRSSGTVVSAYGLREGLLYAARPHRQGRDDRRPGRPSAAQAGRSGEGARAVADLGVERYRCAADRGDRGRAPAVRRRTAAARRPQAGPRARGGAGRRPAEAAAEDPRCLLYTSPSPRD